MRDTGEIRIETERLLVRPLRAEDGEALYAVLSDAEVMRYVEAPFSRRQTAEFIGRVRASEPTPVFAVVWKGTDTLIGHLIYHPFDGESWEEIGPAFDTSEFSDEYSRYGEFTGCFVGMTCADLIRHSKTADFDFFSCRDLTPDLLEAEYMKHKE